MGGDRGRRREGSSKAQGVTLRQGGRCAVVLGRDGVEMERWAQESGDPMGSVVLIVWAGRERRSVRW